MKLKKLTIILCMVLTAVFMVTGCSEKSNNEEVNTEASTENASEETSEEPEGIEGALEGEVLKVGTSGLFAPFSYYDEEGKTLIGYDLDFLYALQDILGFEIDNDTVQAMDYSALTTSVAEGKLDIAMAALCATDTRKEVMNFSDTYYDSGQITVINTESSPEGIDGIEALASGDFLVAVEKGTASHLYAQANIPEKSIEVHDTITTAYESLEQGKVDALLQDTPGIAFYIKTKEGTKLEMVGDEFNQGQAPYAVAVSFDASEENADLVDILNEAIEELTANGTMDEINTKWCK
ncbi:substrate-binding periplasmic protein [Clostridium sp. DL1XJH146]